MCYFAACDIKDICDVGEEEDFQTSLVIAISIIFVINVYILRLLWVNSTLVSHVDIYYINIVFIAS